MIVTVTPNPALDLTWHVERIFPGGTHRADTGASRAGGKGVNVARVAHTQGAAVVALTTAGGATGAEFAAELVSSTVPHELVAVQGATRRSIALVDAHLGDTTIVNERGVNPGPGEWEALKEAVRHALRPHTPAPAPSSDSDRSAAVPSPGSLSAADRSAVVSSPAPSSAADRSAERSETETKRGALAKTAVASRSAAAGAPSGTRAAGQERPVLVISGSLPPGAPDTVLPELIRIGREAGAVVVVDTSGPALLAAADAGAAVLKPNAAELAEATGLADPLAGACELLHRGASLVLLSRGADGMLAITSDEVVRARLAAPLSGNPTGAGDAAVAACAVLLAQGVKEPTALLRRATAWSAAAVLMPLAGEIHPSWPELESRLLVDSPPLTALRPSSIERTPR